MAKLVTVEHMPEQFKSSHRAANNWGQYPMNGAVREKMSREEAEQLIAADEDGYAHIVSVAGGREKHRKARRA
jgi:hypothetical protein